MTQDKSRLIQVFHLEGVERYIAAVTPVMSHEWMKLTAAGLSTKVTCPRSDTCSLCGLNLYTQLGFTELKVSGKTLLLDYCLENLAVLFLLGKPCRWTIMRKKKEICTII
ncbi:hypothetical protein ATANTOWER_012636 [Ataeniobius toweri]|uniref:Uncharacterized protein n=1 Tax=Ataeniobius toweri TaxID=208326 RepID=A0ABU7CG88_9TELE|nr:hypothetical protein [Ataeniobius toweri]